MPSFSKEFLDEVRSRNDIVDVVGSYLKLTKTQGKNPMAVCPFHPDKNPSMSVSRDHQFFHCFACKATGDVITFMMRFNNMEFMEAVESLAERAGMQLPQKEYSKEEKQREQHRARLYEMMKQAAVFYVHALHRPSAEHARAYLAKRELKAETITKFGLGYAPQDASLREYLKGKGFSDELMKEAGLVRMYEKGPRDLMFNRVIFPIMNKDSRVIAFGGRVMGDAQPKYLNSPESELFKKGNNLYGIHLAKKARKTFFIICEGYMDVIALHQAGFYMAVAALGTAFTPEHAREISRFVDNVVLSFDSDGPGKKAALRAIPLLRARNIHVKVLSMTPYKDPDELIKACGPEEYQKRIDEAQNGFLFEMDMLAEGRNISDPEVKTGLMNDMANRLADFEDPVKRRNYAETLSERFRFDFSTLLNKAETYLGMKDPMTEKYLASRPENLDAKKDDTERYNSYKMFLTWLFNEPWLYEDIKGRFLEEGIEDIAMKTAVEALFSQIETNSLSLPGIEDVLRTLPEPPANPGSWFFYQDYQTLPREEKDGAWPDLVKRLINQNLDNLIKKASSIGDDKGLSEANQKRILLFKSKFPYKDKS